MLANATGSPLPTPAPAGPSTPATPVPLAPATATAIARTPYTGGSLPPLTPSAFVAGLPGDKTASELYTMYSRVVGASLLMCCCAGCVHLISRQDCQRAANRALAHGGQPRAYELMSACVQ
eukprot:1161115-Pelagomonas_calceolata.AAC.4